jgi:hypothetical protein
VSSLTLTSADSPITLVNSIYPLEYFSLSGVNQIKQPDNFWWSSKQRYATIDSDGSYLSAANGGRTTSEILEIDLGRIREINYFNFDILRAPIDITIEYDAISSPDRTPTWRSVQQIDDLPFEDGTRFEPDSRNAWHNVEFHFTDEFGNMVHARYFRFTFTRRDEAWPTNGSPAFPWAIFVKHMRPGRYIAGLLDTVGPLLTQDTPNNLVGQTLATDFGDTSFEIRQQFTIPTTTVRAGQTPNLLGFGVLIDPVGTDTTTSDNQVELAWSLYDVTNSATPMKLKAGVFGPLEITVERWVDVYLDEADIIAGDIDATYEFRVQSLNVLTCNKVFSHAPNGLSATSLPGTLTFTNGSSTINVSGTAVDYTTILKPGQYVIRTDTPDQPLLVATVSAASFTTSTPYTGTTTSTTGSIIYPMITWNGSAYVEDASRALVMRAWADIADEGQDVLGNEYRYVVRRNPAVDVLDNNKAGWMSDPMPTPEAVEALYFDTRSIGPDGEEEYTVMEALEIAPRTPGVTMNVYYSQENLHGERPVTTEDWDNLVWASIPKTYTLRRHEIIRFPRPIRAAYMKLEFSALQPLPYNLPSFPPLPPKVYRRFPSWVEDQFQNARLKNLVEDWFLRNSTPVEQKVLAGFKDPVLEFEHKEREFISALSLGTITDQQVVNSSLVSIADKALIDPTTGDKIYVQTPDQYGSPMLSTVDQNGSILGQVVAGQFDPNKLTVPTESQQTPTLGNQVPVVSSINDRVAHSFQSMAQIPMRFNKTVRHIYVKEQAIFNKKAYFVGIDKVKFLRIDYTSAFDDDLIVDNLYDDMMMIENTWGRDAETAITDGQTVYVSYQVGDITVTDEEVVLPGFAAVALQVVGAPARNILVFQAPNQQGIQYFQNMDYQLGYDTDRNGNRMALIERTALANRLSVPIQPVTYQDAFTVVGKGNMPQKFFDAATVVGVGLVTCFEFFGTGYIDSATVTGTGEVTGTNTNHPDVNYGDNTYGTGEYGANPQ